MRQPALTWYTGPAGATWHLITRGIAEWLDSAAFGYRIQVVEGGGRDNPSAVQTGAADFATSVDFLAAAAARGVAPYTSTHPALTTIGVGWTSLPFHLIQAGSATGGLDQALGAGAAGRRLGVPSPSTSDELTFQQVLAFYDTSYPDLRRRGATVTHGSYDQLLDAFGRGGIDLIFGATAAPAPAVAQIARTVPGSRLAPFPEALIAHLCQTRGYVRGSIPAGTYPQLHQGDVTTAVMRTCFLASGDVPDEVVYQVTRLMLTDPERLHRIHPSLAAFNPARGLADPPVPPHPGAVRAYTELGFLPNDRE